MSDDPRTPAQAEPAARQAWDELLAVGVGASLDDDRVADLISVVRRSGEAQFVDAGLRLLSDPLPVRRQWVARVLGQFGAPRGRPFGERIAPALAAAARRESDDATRAEIVDALGSAEDPVWVHELVHHAADPHPAVRVAVAASLPLVCGDEPLDDETVRTLIHLTTDDDGVVRDWATMSLGTQIDRDTPEIRDALAARLDDDSGDTAFEACLGLARRGDDRAGDRLLRRLADPEVPVALLDLVAAAALADPVLLPLLERWDEEWSGQDDEHTALLRLALERSAPDAAARAAELEATALGIAAGIADGSGWWPALTGAYPRTRLWWTGPDGQEVDFDVWDELSPAAFAPQRQARDWVYHVPELTARGES